MNPRYGVNPLLVVVLTLAALVLGLVNCVQQPTPAQPVAPLADYGYLHTATVSATTSGADGSATGSGSSTASVRGHIYAVYLDYPATMTTTTDVTLYASASPTITVLTRSNSATDGWFYPAVQQTTSAGAGAGTYDRCPAYGTIALAIDQSTPTLTLTATIWWGP
ncbi:MAG: hypothetical protein KKA73_14210 [Chloroflexi bacterium]|nr:hypothetical protein [Chloroflexota bacterium]MBU1748839.1 hypothetical protein [Chloroflexota bacterium]